MMIQYQGLKAAGLVQHACIHTIQYGTVALYYQLQARMMLMINVARVYRR
jgi:hypothetical protein